MQKKRFNVRLSFILLFVSLSIGLSFIIVYFLIKQLCINSPDTIDPIGFQVSTDQDGAIRASWTTALRAKSYYVYAKKGSAPGESFYDYKVETRETSHRFTDLLPNNRWYICIQAVNNCGKSELTSSKFVIPCFIVDNTEILSADVLPVDRLTDYPYKVTIKKSSNAEKYNVDVYELSNQLFQSTDQIVAHQTFSAADCQNLICDFNQISLLKFPEPGLQYRFEVTPLNFCSRASKKTSVVPFI